MQKHAAEIKKRVLIGITGASGQIYARAIINALEQEKKEGNNIEFEAILTSTAIDVWEKELGEKAPRNGSNPYIINNSDFGNRNASGSNCADVMIIVPCSMGTIGRIAAGTSDTLLLRAADVMLKERKMLILAPRETPYSLIHLRNMTTLSEAGAIIAPASPSFYKEPRNLEELADTFAYRLLNLAGITTLKEKYRWG
jgi:4-hydroxy-3-polyprenylbenzoate decarboxylase